MEAGDAVERWERQGLVDPELAIRLRQDLAVVDRSTRSHRLVTLVVFVGAVLIGGGLLLFIGSQWDAQSPVRRVALLVAVYALVVAAAALADRYGLVTTSRALWFLAAVTVGVNVFLLGQIFHLPLNYWQGTLLWMIAALAFGWAAPSAAQGWLVVVLGLLTIGWFSVPSADVFDQGAFLWDPAGIRPLLPLVGLALATASTWFAVGELAFLVRPSQVIGVLMVAVPVTTSTFHPTIFAAVWEMEARRFHGVVIVVAIGAIGWAWARTRQPIVPWAAGVLAVLMLVLLVQVEPGEDAPTAVDEFGTTSWFAVPAARSAWVFGSYTAVVFGLALATVIAGQRWRVAALVNVGVGAIAVLTMGVYVDRVAGALPTSIAVLLGGVLLVGAAVVLERKRRDLVAAVEP